MKFLPLLLLVLISTACGTSRSNLASGAADGTPDARSSADLETIAIAATNDIHGGLAPMDFKTRESDGAPSVDYQSGGAAYLASYIKILRSEMGSKMLWLDAGDEFQGTLESNPNRGKAMVRFFNAAGLDAAAIGNHEFDFGAEPEEKTTIVTNTDPTPDLLGSLKARMLEAKYPYLSANIIDAKSGQVDPFPNTFPSHLFTVGKIKVGVVGLTTIDTPRTTLPTNVKSLTFTSLHDAALKQAALLRQQGAQIVVIDAHAGAFCDLTHGNQGHAFRKPNDAQGECRSEDEMTKLIKSLPPGTIDAVVSGHTHSIVHHWITQAGQSPGVPVVQGGANGRYFNVIYLTYDLKDQKILPDRTRIEGPIPVCPAVFQNQGDCNGDRPAPKNGRGPLVAPQFHRSVIEADSSISSMLKPTFDEANQTKNEVRGQAATPLLAKRSGEGELGNLFADAIRSAAHADFAIMNAGGIRAGIEQGPITYGAIFRASPFDNTIVTIKLSGKQLRNVLQVAESGARGFPPVSGLQLKLIHPDYDAPSKDLNGDDKIEPWEINRLLEVKSPDGPLLDDRKQYTLATIDFLVLGGDDFAWPMAQIDPGSVQFTGILTREALSRYIGELTRRDGAVNTAQHLLVRVDAPRMTFVKAKPGKKTRRRRRKRH